MEYWHIPLRNASISSCTLLANRCWASLSRYSILFSLVTAMVVPPGINSITWSTTITKTTKNLTMKKNNVTMWFYRWFILSMFPVTLECKRSNVNSSWKYLSQCKLSGDLRYIMFPGTLKCEGMKFPVIIGYPLKSTRSILVCCFVVLSHRFWVKLIKFQCATFNVFQTNVTNIV